MIRLLNSDAAMLGIALVSCQAPPPDDLAEVELVLDVSP